MTLDRICIFPDVPKVLCIKIIKNKIVFSNKSFIGNVSKWEFICKKEIETKNFKSDAKFEDCFYTMGET